MEPWPRLAEEIVYRGDRTIARRHYRQPDGAETTFDVTLHGSVVSVLALDEGGKVVLARQFRPGPERVLFDLPSGYVEDDEDVASAAARELAEETGYVGTMREVGRTTPNAYSTEVRHIFVATDCRRRQEPDTEDDEDIEIVLVTVDRLRELLRGDELTVVDGAYLALDVLGLL
ncbi:MAG TPA: NUDIX hydrolase [Acidimicrobiales bacterium]|nr:NUDIX hydrolase [Acidimicrobiales bacterium]